MKAAQIDGRTRLSDEHIIPLSLGGNLVLREASCDECAKIINSQIETPVLFKEWKLLRIKRGFPSRSKKKDQPTHLTLMSKWGSPIRVPIQDYSCPVPAYQFKTARILDDSNRGDDNKHWTMAMYADTDEEANMRIKFPAWNGQHNIRAQPYQFARLLAKIAYGRVVSEYGLDGFKPLVLDIILGKSDDYFYTVGGEIGIQPRVEGGDHILDIEVHIQKESRALIVVYMRLFSQIESPHYRVVVGEIDLNNPNQRTILDKHSIDGKLIALPIK